MDTFKSTQTIEGLIPKLEAFISKNRGSLNDDELVMLTKCIELLNEHEEGLRRKEPNYDLIVKVCELLFKVFLSTDALKKFLDLF